ncbi:MAG TPA: hypothetical protein VFN19_02935, partial [Candidatus Nanopelagicales bacterium]|nr:hypothetical protein [Candidatus Nanopelagicales bacterium]
MSIRRLGGAVWFAAVALALGMVPLSTTSAAAAPSDERIVYFKGCDIWIAPPSGVGAKQLTSGATTCSNRVTISHTGRYVAYQSITGSTTKLMVLDLATGVDKELTAAGGGGMPDFSPTSDTIAYSRYDKVK